jgi:hypothetical protein
MNSELWPKDPVAAAALVALVIHDIHELENGDDEVLLSDFLRTAWPSVRAQCQ